MGQKILGACGYGYMKLIYLTTKWDVVNDYLIDHVIQSKRPLIICFWHHRLLMLPAFWHHRGVFKMLLSAHGDGKLIANVVKPYGIDAISGSTNRNGDKAAIAIIHALKEGHTIGITPDGPRGPNQKASPGIANLAKLSDAVILPVCYGTKRHLRLKSWDRFFLPLPFSKGAFIVGSPIDAKDFDDTENLRLTIETALNHICDETDATITGIL